MGYCVAYGCINRPSKKTGITLHSFPKDEALRQHWTKAIRRKNWFPTKYSKICSAHFPEEMIDRSSLSCVRLRENAVPSIFPAFPSFLQKTLAEKEEIEKTYKVPQTKSSETVSSESNDEDDIESNEEEYCEDVADETTSASACEYLAELANRVTKSNECSTKPKINEPLTETPYIHKPVVSQNQVNANNEPYSNFTPVIGTVVSVPLLPKVVHYVPTSLNESPANGIYLSDTATPTRDILVEQLKKKLEEKEYLLEKYRKKIKYLHQSNRRFRIRLANVKHSIFAELQKRKYLSSDSSYKIGSQGCLLDRNSIKICESESEDSDEELS